MKNIVFVVIPFFIAFFPAYFRYHPSRGYISYIIIVMFAMTCFGPFIKDTGIKGIYAIFALGIVGYTIESIGVLTCFPYGCFVYSNQLGPKIYGIVPWLLFFSWSPLVIGVRSMVSRVMQGFCDECRKNIMSTIGLVLVDLILDPLAVAMGLRSYPGGGVRFGVPWTNFLGWILSGGVGMMILSYIFRNQTFSTSYHYGLLCFLSFFVGWGVWCLVF